MRHAKVSTFQECELRGCCEVPHHLPPLPFLSSSLLLQHANLFQPSEFVKIRMLICLRNGFVDLGKLMAMWAFRFYPPKAKYPSLGQRVPMSLDLSHLGFAHSLLTSSPLLSLNQSKMIWGTLKFSLDRITVVLGTKPRVSWMLSKFPPSELDSQCLSGLWIILLVTPR